MGDGGFMSWSISFTGTPSNIAKAIDTCNLTGQSKIEYDSVKDGLKQVVLANSDEIVIDLDANGHAYTDQNGQKFSTCQVTLRKLGLLIE